MKTLIFGLGNIGPEYHQTRHNIGFEVIDAFAEKHNCSFALNKHAMLAEGRIKNQSFVLIKPTTYMNLSGKAVQYYLQQYKCSKDNILVITDDLAIECCQLRMRLKGNHGGHNGLRNIQETLNSGDYPRLRFGIGSQFNKHQQIDFVLGKWKPEEVEAVGATKHKAVLAIESFLLEGASKAMTQFNG